MYRKLAFRNAKRSFFDYLLYITTMIILITVMCISNCIAIWGNMQSGFQAVSLPLLIVLILVILVNYINLFMLKQRAKELATYLLLGLEKNKLSQMFILEFYFIGIPCFLFGCLMGIGIYLRFFPGMPQELKIQLPLIIKSMLLTFLFFILVEILSGFCIRQKMYKLQIYELMNEKQYNYPLIENRKRVWTLLFMISFLILFFLMCGIVLLTDTIVFFIVSLVSIPLLCCTFTFYKWIYAYFTSKRFLQSKDLYQDNRLYLVAEMTFDKRTHALINTVLCICLIFSATAFVFGTFSLHLKIFILSHVAQQWMGFLQISLCIILLTIYFSILSLQQIIALKRQLKSIRILQYMGKSELEIKQLIIIQILLKLLLPTLWCFILLLVGTPFINHKIKMIFPIDTHSLLLQSISRFIGCFTLLYLCYFLVVYIISKRFLLGKNISQ